MKRLILVALAVAAPVQAQRTSQLPAAAPLTGSEAIQASQGSGCNASPPVQPCLSVKIAPSQIVTYLGTTFQPRDTDLDAIAALTTQPFGRSLLTQTDAASVRMALGGLTWPVCKSGTVVSVTGTTAETVLATCSIPAGAIGPNGIVEAAPATFTMTGSANAKVLRLKLNGSELWSSTIGGTTVALRALIAFNNSGSPSSQLGLPLLNGIGQGTSVLRTSVNTANATTLTISCQLAVAAETCSLESYLIRITYGA